MCSSVKKPGESFPDRITIGDVVADRIGGSRSITLEVSPQLFDTEARFSGTHGRTVETALAVAFRYG